MINWTPSTRQNLSGVREPHEKDPKDAVPSLDKAWKILKKNFDDNVGLWQVNVASKFDDAIQKVRDDFARDKPPTELDVTTEMVRARAIFQGRSLSFKPTDWKDWADARALMSLWSEVEGEAFALKLLLTEPILSSISAQSTDPSDCVLSIFVFGEDPEPAMKEAVGLGDLPPGAPVGAPLEFCVRGDDVYGLKKEIDPMWKALRWRLTTMGANRLQEVVDSLSDVRANTQTYPSWIQCHLAYVFSNHPEWPREIMKNLPAAADGKSPEGMNVGLISIDDFETAKDIAQRYPFLNTPTLPFDLIENFGVQAREILEPMIEKKAEFSAMKFLKPYTGAMKLLEKSQ